MPMFLAERYLAGINRTALREMTNILEQTAAGQWFGSLALPDDDLCLSIFRAATLAEVRHLNDRAGVGYERIARVIAAPRSRFS